MDFTIPTTKAQMYQTLKNIYNYYRIQRNGFTPVQFEDLELTRITFTPLTDAELRLKATDLVSASQEKEKLSRKEKLEREKSELEEKLSDLDTKEQELITKITSRYTASRNSIETETARNGFSNSSVLLDKLTELENAKNAEILQVNTDYANKRLDYNAKITAIDGELQSISTYYSQVFSAEVTAKFLELKDAQEKMVQSVTKYNGAQDEKEQKQQISTALANAELQVKFLALQSNSFSKEQLVEMGYYEDVIRCIKGYYDSLSASNAYNDFAHEENLVFYLEDYHSDILYLYKTLATG